MGTSCCRPKSKLKIRDHPHACGDKRVQNDPQYKGVGSSPRVWGQVIPFSAIIPHVGIIPTRVGTRIFFIFALYRVWDHPHACGDKHNTCKHFCLFQGSSPRVWGQVYRIWCAKNTIRIIPTRVGTRFNKCANLQTIWDHPHACGDKT